MSVAVELATRALTGPFPAPKRTDEAGALPSPAVVLSVRLKQYYDPLRRPPGTTSTSQWYTPVIGRDAPAALADHRAGEGLPSSRRHLLNVPHPLRRRVLHGCTSRLYTASMAFTPNYRARHSLLPARRRDALTTRQASLDAADRSVASPARAFDAGLRHRAFPPDTASLLPGLLAATRTGLPPAGDDELAMSDQLNNITSISWAH